MDLRTGLLRLSIHAWLVRTPTRVILVDTATGNDKDRPGMPNLNRLNEPFLDRLKAAGARSEEVDLVLHTHLHADHVGWNTSKVDGRWVPTFPNARYFVSGRERAYLAALSASDGSDAAIRAEVKLGRMTQPPQPGVYEDSVLPVIDAGLAREIVVDGKDSGGRFLLSPKPRSQHRPRLHPLQLPGRTGAVLGRRDAPSAAVREAGLELDVLRVPRGRPEVAPMGDEPRSRNQGAPRNFG